MQNIIDQLQTVLDENDAKLRELAIENTRIREAIRVLAGSDDHEPAPVKLAAVRTTTVGHPVEEHVCPDCDRTFDRKQGLQVHRARSHKANAWTPEPITKTAVDEHAAREAAAAAL